MDETRTLEEIFDWLCRNGYLSRNADGYTIEEKLRKAISQIIKSIEKNVSNMDWVV